MQNKSRRQFLFSGFFAVLTAPFVRLPKQQPNLVRRYGWFKECLYKRIADGREYNRMAAKDYAALDAAWDKHQQPLLESNRKILAGMKQLNQQLSSGEFDRPIGTDEAIEFINKLKEIA